jgi:hypothetical protein
MYVTDYHRITRSSILDNYSDSIHFCKCCDNALPDDVSYGGCEGRIARYYGSGRSTFHFIM